jgi:hypothetical protein
MNIISSIDDLSGNQLSTSISPERTTEGGVKTEAVNPPTRISALDFTKGALVLFMVLYHWLIYFQGPHGFIFRYLRFLPPSFIFITGFLISNAYLAKYEIADPRLPKRLVIRGLKIMVIFVLLNVAIGFLVTGFQSWDLDKLMAVFVTGNVLVAGVGKAASFYILVPISYLLLLSAMLLVICRFYKYTFYVVFAGFLLGIFVLSLEDFASANLEFLTIGLLGLIFGYAPIEKVNAFVRHPYRLVAAYLCYAVVITVRDPNYPLQAVGVLLTVMLVYLVGSSSPEPGKVRRLIILLGRYPLVGYIAQVAILQLLRSGLRHVDLGISMLVLSFGTALGLTVIVVVALDRARLKSLTVNHLYTGIFS